jgi:uncharacterized protein
VHGHPVTVAGESLVLLPERAIAWPARDALLIADPHWGKAATFRAHGLPVPGGTTAADLARLDQAIESTAARRLIVLGDFWHARRGRTAAIDAALQAWRARHTPLDVLLVRGNHDRHAGDPAAALGFEVVDAPFLLPPFTLSHHPVSASGTYTLAGHLHPAVRLRGPGRSRERLPCFVVGQDLAILPAFGAFTGAADVEPGPDVAVYAVAGDEVIPVG